MEFCCLIETEGGNKCNLNLFANHINAAKNKAKRLSRGCKVLGVVAVEKVKEKVFIK